MMNPSTTVCDPQVAQPAHVGSSNTRLQLSCCFLALLASASVANAQMMINPMLPLPPSPAPANSLKPTGAIPAQAFLPTSVTFSWRTGQYYASQPQAGPANSFIVCLYDTAAGETCSSTPLRWVRAASSFSRTPVTNPYANPPQIVLMYEYRLDAQTIAATRQDKNLTWKVFACATTVGTFCTDMTPVPLRLSTKNLRAENISTNGSESNRQGVLATAVASNTGTTDSGAFEGHLELWEVYYDPVARSCRTDLSWPQLPANASVIIANGTTRTVSGLPRRPDGSFDTRGLDIRGIFAPGMGHDDDSFATKLAAGAREVPLEDNSHGPTLTHDPNSPTDRAAWVMFMKLDTLDSVKEFDELDNLRIECKSF